MNVKGQPKTNFALILHINKYKYHRHTPTVGILDSGATDSFVPMSYKGTKERLNHHKVIVGCVNGATMESVATNELDYQYYIGTGNLFVIMFIRSALLYIYTIDRY